MNFHRLPAVGAFSRPRPHGVCTVIVLLHWVWTASTQTCWIRFIFHRDRTREMMYGDADQMLHGLDILFTFVYWKNLVLPQGRLKTRRWTQCVVLLQVQLCTKITRVNLFIAMHSVTYITLYLVIYFIPSFLCKNCKYINLNMLNNSMLLNACMVFDNSVYHTIILLWY